MKRYTNFSKYFNTKPRFWIVVLGLAVGIPVVLFLGAMIYGVIVTELESASHDIKKSFIGAIICCFGMAIGMFGLIGKLYRDQVTLVNASIGKDFRRRGYDVVYSLDKIESELEAPMLAQIHSGINRSVNFIITKNWIVGTDDLIAMRVNAVRISEIAAVDLNEIDNTSISHGSARPHAHTKHYSRVKLTDRYNRIYCFTVLNEECQREAYEYITKNIIAYTSKDMLVEKEKLGYVPIKYERGERSNREYKSKCLEYCFKIPDGCVLETVEELEGESTPEEIQELYAQMPSGANVTVIFLPMDGSLKDVNIDNMGTSMVEGINRKFEDRRATYYGTVEFLGKQCAHSVIEQDRSGIHFFSEAYAYFAPYCQVMFVFTYINETMGDFDILKQAFRG